MKKMPPLPNRKNPKEPPSLELVSNRLKIPPRYNSIERVIREAKDEYQESQNEQTKQNKNLNSRQNIHIRRPYSAKQTSASRGRSMDSRGSNDSKQSIGSRGKSFRRRQSPHYNMKMRVSMPSITAHSWVLYQMKEEKFIYGKSNFKKRQIASLTKIMNLVTMLRLLDREGLTASKIRLNVTKEACTLIGTTAMLKPHIQVSLEDLFYGMMLPSGNDAAHQVAQVGGIILTLLKDGPLDKNIVYNCQQISYLMNNTPNIVGVYLHQMNQTARKLDLSRSSWANPHGLSNVNNVSTAEDMAKLCMYAMKNNQFREVVSTKNYNCVYFYEKTDEDGDSQIAKDVLKWENTNKMLWEGWTGIKTGITPNAGPCLAASCQRMLNGREYEFLVILIKSESMEARWGEVRQLVDWITLGNWFSNN